MTVTVPSPTLAHVSALQELLSGIISQFGGAIDFWTLVCLSPRELGNAAVFVDNQSSSLRETVQELRACLSSSEYEPSEAVYDQVAKLARSATDLREVFDIFVNAGAVARNDLEAAVMKLSHIWQEVRMRVWLLGALIPVAEPPTISLEKDQYFRTILDGLFDRFLAVRQAERNQPHARNGKG